MYELYSIRVPNKHIMMFNQFLKSHLISHLISHFFSSFYWESLKIAPEYRLEGWNSDNLMTLGPSRTVLSLHNPKKGRAVTERQFPGKMHTLFTGELFQNRLSRLVCSLLKMVPDHTENSSVLQSWLGKTMHVKIGILRHSRGLLKKITLAM